MNKKFWISVAVVFVVLQVLDGLVHGLILLPTYEATADVWRPQAETKLAVMIITRFIFAFFFTFVFSKSYQGGYMEGVRYGFYTSMLVNLTYAYGNYAILDIPYSLALQWFIYGTLELMIAGVVLSKTMGKNETVS